MFQTISGRSMIEMLGVLAIIGVLSIGALAGYSFAMNKHRANVILHDVMLQATALQTIDGLSNGPLDLSEAQTESGLIYEGAKTADSFAITALAVPEKVCRRLVEVQSRDIESISAACDGDTDVTFTFDLVGNNDGISGQPSTSGSGCNDADAPTSCLIFGDVTQDGCITLRAIDCDPGQKCEDDGTCAACPALGTKGVCQVDDTSGECPAYENALDGTACEVSTGVSGTCNAGVCEEPAPANCEAAMIAAGYSGYTMQDATTIDYNGSLTVSTKLNLRGCTLKLEGILTIANGGELIIDEVKVRDELDWQCGIVCNGKLTANRLALFYGPDGAFVFNSTCNATVGTIAMPFAYAIPHYYIVGDGAGGVLTVTGAINVASSNSGIDLKNGSRLNANTINSSGRWRGIQLSLGAELHATGNITANDTSNDEHACALYVGVGSLVNAQNIDVSQSYCGLWNQGSIEANEVRYCQFIQEENSVEVPNLVKVCP